jgi:hypothetical protein
LLRLISRLSSFLRVVYMMVVCVFAEGEEVVVLWCCGDGVE